MYVSDSTMTDLNLNLVPMFAAAQDANAESKDVTFKKGGESLCVCGGGRYCRSVCSVTEITEA